MKRLLTICLIGLITWLVAADIAQADHIGLPIKWSQLPDMDTGVDQYSVHLGNAVASNDWLCDNPLAVVAVRWWGSYLDGHQPDLAVRPTFELVFHFDVPAGMPDPWSGDLALPYSHPTSNPPQGWLYYEHVTAQERLYGVSPAGNVYVYDAYLSTPFDQAYWRDHQDNPVPGSGIFWLDIGYASPLGPDTSQWGWHEAVDPVLLDNAISNPNWHFGPWSSPPITVLDRDLAFELMVVPAPGAVLLGILGLSVAGIKLRKHA